MSEKFIAIVTGASRGIGREVSKLLSKDFHVIISGRTVEALEELDDEIRLSGGSSTIVPMDLNDFNAIKNLSEEIKKRWGKLDVMIANAAYLHDLTPLADLDEKNWHKSINVNLTSIWILIKYMQPLLLKSKAGRAVILTSGAALGERPFWGGYAVSKAALESLTRVWAGEMKETNLRINLFDPGATQTTMRAKAYPGENPKNLKPPIEAAKSIIELCNKNFSSHGFRFKHEN